MSRVATDALRRLARMLQQVTHRLWQLLSSRCAPQNPDSDGPKEATQLLAHSGLQGGDADHNTE